MHSWTANQDLGSAGADLNTFTKETISAVTLRRGDVVKIEGTYNGNEYARVDFIDVQVKPTGRY